MSTSRPVNRAEFKELCLRKLGKPVIDINVTDDQVEDAVEEAISYFIDYHYSGVETTYLKHQLTSDDVTNKYVTLNASDELIVGVQRVWPLSSTSASPSDIFSIDYQIKLDALTSLADFQLAPYYSMRMKYSLIEEVLVGIVPIRFNKQQDRLYLDVSPEKLIEGTYIIIECFTAINDATNTDMWNERIFQKHATALIKKTWGQSLSKFEGVQLPGGITMNGREIYNDAITEIQQIEDEYQDLKQPPMDVIL